MPVQMNAAFSVAAWDEKPFAEYEGGAKLTRAVVTYRYEGDIQGESHMEYLMSYHGDGRGTYVGLERIDGSIGGRKGTFILHHNGTFAEHSVEGVATVAEGSATGDLQGLRGEGVIKLAGQQERYPFSFHYTLP